MMTVLAVVATLLMMIGHSVSAAIYTGGYGANYSMGAMVSDVSLGGAVVTFTSAANQSFLSGDTPVGISMITITDDDTTPGIKSGIPIVIRIPSNLVMTWDETDLTPTFGGTASGKVGSISYASGNKHLVINVTGDFAAGDTLTIANLSFKNYLSGGPSKLELDFNNDNSVDSHDDKTISILSSFHYGGIDDGYAVGSMRRDR